MIRMKTKLLLVFVTTVMLFSCSKEEMLTDGEIIGQEIKALTDSENVKLASTYMLNYYNSEPSVSSDEYQRPFEISGQIIKVGDTYYNLSKLSKYRIRTYNDIKCINLTFDVY